MQTTERVRESVTKRETKEKREKLSEMETERKTANTIKLALPFT